MLTALQQVALIYLARTVATDIPFWRMATQPLAELGERAEKVAATAGAGTVVATEAVPGAGSAPGVTIPSCGIAVEGDHLVALRAHPTPVVARVREGRTYLDLRSVDPSDDGIVAEALTGLAR